MCIIQLKIGAICRYALKDIYLSTPNVYAKISVNSTMNYADTISDYVIDKESKKLKENGVLCTRCVSCTSLIYQ